MREIQQPVTVRVFEGEACRVTVKRNGKEIDVFVDTLRSPQTLLMSPEGLSRLSADLAAVACRVTDAAREMRRDPDVTGRETT